MKQFSKEELIEIKENIMNGRSITSEANRLEIDRKILKKYILNVLDEEEQEKFNTKLSSNLRKNRISVRRQKRISAEERYKNAVEELVKKGIDKEDITIIYAITSSKSHAKMAKDTFVLKLLDLLEFAEMRSKDIKPEDTGYIGKKEVMEMIKRDPKIMTNDMRNKIRPMCETLEKRPDFSKADVNEIIKNNPHIFRNSIKKINMLEIIGENFLIRKGIEYVDLFKYILIFKPHMLAMNPERLYKRLYPIVNIKKSTIITEEDLNDISKRGKEDEITTDDSQIAFPEYDPRNPEKFRTEIKKNLNVKRDKVKEQ